VVALVWVGATWPHFRDAATLSNIFALAALAMLTNLAYCAAYLADIAMRHVAPLDLYRPRTAVLLLGMALAIVLENYWIADEIYASVR
jgi:hypothetical protein